MIHQFGQARALESTFGNHVGEYTNGADCDQAFLQDGVLLGRFMIG